MTIRIQLYNVIKKVTNKFFSQNIFISPKFSMFHKKKTLTTLIENLLFNLSFQHVSREIELYSLS